MATSAPVPQGNPPDPQVVTESSRTAVNVNRATLLRNDPATAAAYVNYRTSVQRALTEKYEAEGASLSSAREDAEEQAEEAANRRFAPQIVAAGAGTFAATTDPLLPQQPQPPSGPVTPVAPAANPQTPAATTPATVAEAGAPPVNPATNPQVRPDPRPPVVENVTVDGQIRAITVNGVRITNPTDFNNIASAIRRAAEVEAKYANLPFGSPLFSESVEASIAATNAVLAAGTVALNNIRAGSASPGSQPSPVAPAVNPQVPDVSLPEEQASPAAPVDPAVNPQVPAVPAQQGVRIGDGGAAARAAQEQAARNNARAQAQLQAQKAQAASGDWRLKLRLAPGSDYLYNASEPGILQPLKVTDGVIFPYTPAITTTYTAMYNNYELTHSNYKGYFYQGSNVGELNITATFTAQDSNEAAYLLAVIQFFKSVTKMFYGQQDAFRGSPPPLVFLQGYGDFQFNLNPCVVQTFNYNLPADVDYIRAGAPNINGTNLLQRRDRQTATVGTNNPSASRMSAAGLTPGGTRPPPPPTTLGRAQPTYVPTKMEMTLVLLPMQTRSQISRQFSMEKFANGSLVQRGFW
jgi:hypothetical protein